MMVGPIQFTFMYWEPRGSPRCHISSERIACRHGVASAPPNSAGQLWVSQPRSASFAQNSFEKADWASLPGPCRDISSQSEGRPAHATAGGILLHANHTPRPERVV
jgi:hypothetical protein